MSAVALSPVVRLVRSAPPIEVTLLDLVQTVSEFASSEEELIATISHMLETGRVRLSGNFRDAHWA